MTYKIPRYKFEGVRVFTNKPPCGPKRGHGTPQPRFALECQIDKIAEQLGLDPADMRRAQPSPSRAPKTANHLTRDAPSASASASTAWCEASGWREKRAGKLPLGHAAIGIAARAYIAARALPIYWNDMPHSGVHDPSSTAAAA